MNAGAADDCRFAALEAPSGAPFVASGSAGDEISVARRIAGVSIVTQIEEGALLPGGLISDAGILARKLASGGFESAFRRTGDLRVAHDGAAHRDALALPARERPRLAVEQRFELEDRAALPTRSRIAPLSMPGS